MRVGILTFISTTDNYGQLFQAYALQKYLESLGHDVFFIRYQMGRLSFREQLRFFKYDPVKRIKHFISLLFRKMKKKEDDFTKKNPRYFEEFRNKYFKLTPQIYTTIKQLQENPPDADIYICGSDQIWNMNVFENARAYFLDFGPTSVRRIAYAPSFGKKHVNKAFSEFIKPMLSRFDGISVRETSGIAICNEAGYIASTTVVDPTLLLEVEDYKELFKNKLKWNAENKCLCYFLNFEKPENIYWNNIKELVGSLKIDMRLVVSSGANAAIDILNSEYYAPSPYDFLLSFNCADYIITNSYHGTIFSIIMEKKFVVIPLDSKTTGMNERIYSLLSELGLLDRVYGSNKIDLKETLISEINWCSVRQKIKDNRQHSKNWLNNKLIK